jgi:hypothetical protein
MSKRGGAPAALMRGRREGCEKRLPRQCEALERWRSRTLSGASSTVKARERGETCPMRRNAPHALKRPNAQTPKRPTSAASSPKKALNPQHPTRPAIFTPHPARSKRTSRQPGVRTLHSGALAPGLVRSTALLFSIANYNFWTPSIGRVRVIPRVIPASVQATALSGRRVPWHRERCASV